jgi:DNA-binding XRE family transcriptional regulator
MAMIILTKQLISLSIFIKNTNKLRIYSEFISKSIQEISGNISSMNNDYETVSRNVGINIRRLRKERGKSQEQLAFDSDIDRTYIGYIENGKYSVSLKKLCAIAKALEVDVEVLFKAN